MSTTPIKARICPEHMLVMKWYKEKKSNVCWSFCPVCGERPDWIDASWDEDHFPYASDLVADAYQRIEKLEAKVKDLQGRLLEAELSLGSLRKMAKSLESQNTAQKERLLESAIALSAYRKFVMDKGLWKEFVTGLSLERSMLFGSDGGEIK